MLKVAITGGSGFLANHLIKYLQENADSLVGEIRTIDRKPFTQFLDYPNRITTTHFRCDLCNSARLEKILVDVDVIFHLARKSVAYMLCADQSALNEQYLTDNLNATKCLVNALIEALVPNLIYVGDAYANLPPSDNFGTSEMIHNDVPKTFLLGEYGSTRTHAELYARRHCGQKLANGTTLNCIFLRPTFIYGEGDTKLLEAFNVLAANNDGCVTHLQGSSRGMHQYIYAGSLARIMVESMQRLMDEPQKLSGEFFYCMDDTRCTKFNRFFSPLIEALGYRTTQKAGSDDEAMLTYYLTLTGYALADRLAPWWSSSSWWWRWLPSTQSHHKSLSYYALRLFYAFSFGFSDRKLRLLLRCDDTTRPVATTGRDVSKWLSRTAKWAKMQDGGEHTPVTTKNGLNGNNEVETTSQSGVTEDGKKEVEWTLLNGGSRKTSKQQGNVLRMG